MASNATGAPASSYVTSPVKSVSHRTLDFIGPGRGSDVHDVADVEVVAHPTVVDHDEAALAVDVGGETVQRLDRTGQLDPNPTTERDQLVAVVQSRCRAAGR